MEEDSLAGILKRQPLKYCSVKECPHYYGTDNANIRFFRCPESLEEHAKWAKIIFGDGGIDVPPQYQMCNLHFNSDDIVTYRMIQKIPMTKLKKGAIPLPLHIQTKGSKNPLGDVKLVDIDDIKRTAPMNTGIIQSDSQSSKKICKDCIYYDIKLQKANMQIAALQAKVTELTKKLEERPLIKKIINKKCKLCKVLIPNREFNSHLCLKQNSITCAFCTQPKSFKSTISFLCHINEHEAIKSNAMYECDKCSVAYPMEVLLECHKKSHIEQDVEVIDLDETEEAVTINGDIELKPLDTNEQSDESNESNLFKYEDTIEPFTSFEPIVKVELEEQDVEMIEIDKPIEDILTKMLKPYKCCKCNESFEKCAELTKHMQRFCKKIPNHKLKKIFICTICKKESLTLGVHEKHMIKHKQRCEICNELYLDDHLCGNENSICCEYCDESFTITVNLLKHLEETHEHKKLYRCGKCPKFLPMICLKEFHIKQHENEPKKPFTCEICSKSITSKCGLQAHMKIHTNDKSNLCDECGKSFASAAHLAIHKKSILHGKEPHIQCKNCPKKFVRLADLKRHSTLHRENKYVCEICKAELISVSGYRQHMKRHTRTEADRKYACKICPLKFYTPKDLNHHQTAHSTKKRFDCQLCDQSYKYSGDLNKHMKIHLGDKIHGCTKCPMRFQYPMELTKHSFEHYKEENEINEQMST